MVLIFQLEFEGLFLIGFCVSSSPIWIYFVYHVFLPYYYQRSVTRLHQTDNVDATFNKCRVLESACHIGAWLVAVFKGKAYKPKYFSLCPIIPNVPL